MTKVRGCSVFVQPRHGIWNAKKKQPWRFRVKGGEPFAFAGLWEFWKSPEGEPVESCTIITTDANDVLRPVGGFGYRQCGRLSRARGRGSLRCAVCSSHALCHRFCVGMGGERNVELSSMPLSLSFVDGCLPLHARPRAVCMATGIVLGRM